MEESYFISNVKLFENGHRSEIPYLYLDTKGKVTIGTGLMYSTPHQLIQDHLQFTVNGSGKAATEEQIKAAFQAVKKHAKGLAPEIYKSIKENNLSASSNRLNSIFTGRLEKAKGIAEKWFAGDVANGDLYPTFDSLPEDIQYALKDMAFNMGNNEIEIKGLIKFKKFRRALHEGDFGTAAKESYRPDCKRGSLRNQRVYDWINQYDATSAFTSRALV